VTGVPLDRSDPARPEGLRNLAEARRAELWTPIVRRLGDRMKDKGQRHRQSGSGGREGVGAPPTRERRRGMTARAGRGLTYVQVARRRVHQDTVEVQPAR
jgi:hypothetical protein